jgi:hypothetical protein
MLDTLHVPGHVLITFHMQSAQQDLPMRGVASSELEKEQARLDLDSRTGEL